MDTMANEHKKKKKTYKFIAHAIQSKTYLSIKVSKYAVQAMKHTQYTNTDIDTSSHKNNFKKKKHNSNYFFEQEHNSNLIRCVFDLVDVGY